MRKIIIDKDGAIYISVICNVLSVLRCHSCLEEASQRVLPMLFFIFSKYSGEAKSMPH